LDNSDDLNRFINKYEEILTANKEKTGQNGTAPDINSLRSSGNAHKYNSASAYQQSDQGNPDDNMVEDEIDNLVDEELSRNDNSELSGEENNQIDSADAFEINRRGSENSGYAT
jgi:hypothetical protein